MKRLLFASSAALALFAGAGFVSAKAFVLPHVLEKSGRITNTQFTFDTTLFVTYTPGVKNSGGGGGQGGRKPGDMSFLVTWKDDNGNPVLSDTGQPACNPCGPIQVAPGHKVEFSFDDAMMAAGGFPKNPVPGLPPPPVLGYAIIVVGGADPDNVTMQGFVVNSHTSAFDLSVFGFEPQPIQAAP